MSAPFSWDLPYAWPRMPLLAANAVATSQPLAAQAGLHRPRPHAAVAVPPDRRRYLAVPPDQELRFRKALIARGHFVPGRAPT